MKIKTKLTFGVGLLFMLIILLSLVSAKYLYDLKSDTENVLVDNYRTLEYSRNMLLALEEGGGNAVQRFQENLANQENNITEVNEKEVTARLRAAYGQYQKNQSDESLKSEIRNAIFQLMDMNMKSIQQKSKLAEKTANKAVFWIAVTGTLCVVIAFFLFVNLPSNIANPIRALKEGIMQIANKNYSERVHFEKNSEFGEVAKSFKSMAQKLEEYDNSNLAKLMI